jgi:hypothetical protein
METFSMGASAARLLVLVTAVCAVGLAACGNGPVPTPTPARTAEAPHRTGPVPSRGPATRSPTDPTPVPVADTPGPTEVPEPVPTQVGVTDTPWGAIVDEIPSEWPVFPGSEAVESEEGPASGAWLAPGEVDTVADWYRDTLVDQGYTIDNLSSPLEDGTRILDVVTDLPECRIQAAFRPRDGMTMVTVLYGAGCAGGDG